MTTRLRIEPDDITDPAVVALLQGHVDQMRDVTPSESTHALDLDALRAPGLRLWVARAGDDVVGCAALKRLSTEHAELKSMRTAPDRTRQGVATALLGFIIRSARSDGVRRISLETGSGDFFAPAHRLYLRHGFVDCPPFGAYVVDPLSRFLTLDLTVPLSRSEPR